MSGFIYAIECASRIKIGFSEDPDRRLNKVASDAPFPCVLLGYWPGSVADELAVHDHFRAIRLYGEWFASTVDLLALIADLSTMQERESKIVVQPPIEPDQIDDWPAIIRRIQYLKGWRQGQLAGAIGVHQSLLSKWKADQHEPAKQARNQLRALLAEAEKAHA